MSKQSERVKKWRRRCKERIIEAMGGQCCVCGYKKCQSALALHHLDPSQKDFGLGTIRANVKSWTTIVVELRKCVLVCNNCHGEIHEGLASIPDDAPKFNEDFADYKKLEEQAKDIMTPCPVCGKMKAAHMKNCSLECAGRARYKVDWDKVDLQEEIKTKSIVQIAEELGCSDGAVHKRLRKLKLK